MDLGFEPGACDYCYDDIDSLIDERPACMNGNKICKYFNHCRDFAPVGKVSFFKSAGGLEEFERLSDKIIGLSAWDGGNLPTVSFYAQASGETGFSENEFQELLLIKLNHIRSEIITAREKAATRGA